MNQPAPLTPDILAKLPFSFSMHINGGDKFSKKLLNNDEYKLVHITETNGSPKYKIREQYVYLAEHPKIQLDLKRRKTGDLEAFCQAYNEARRSGA